MSQTDSPRLLKARSVRGLGTKIVLDYTDIEQQCGEHLESARAEAETLLAEARQEAARLREHAVEHGRAEGREQGLAVIEQEIENRAGQQAMELVAGKLDSVIPAISRCAALMQEERERWLAEWESMAVHLCTAIAEKIIRAELATHPDRVVELIKHTLQLAAGTTRLSVKLHPDDIALLGDDASQLVRALSGCAEAMLCPDGSLTRGDCVLETQHGAVDARLETQLSRIAAELID